MRTRSQNPFSTVTTSGLLLPIDLLARVADGDPDLKGLKAKDYHLRGGERLNEAAARAWNQCLAAWKSFRNRFQDLPESDIGTTTTRDEWLLPLFQELGYGRLQTKKALEFDGAEYPITPRLGRPCTDSFAVRQAAARSSDGWNVWGRDTGTI